MAVEPLNIYRLVLVTLRSQEQQGLLMCSDVEPSSLLLAAVYLQHSDGPRWREGWWRSPPSEEQSASSTQSEAHTYLGPALALVQRVLLFAVVIQGERNDIWTAASAGFISPENLDDLFQWHPTVASARRHVPSAGLAVSQGFYRTLLRASSLILLQFASSSQ